MDGGQRLPSLGLAGRPLSALYANQGGTPGDIWTYDAAGRRITESTNGRALAFTYESDSNPAAIEPGRTRRSVKIA